MQQVPEYFLISNIFIQRNIREQRGTRVMKTDVLCSQNTKQTELKSSNEMVKACSVII